MPAPKFEIFHNAFFLIFLTAEKAKIFFNVLALKFFGLVA
jgi:hypothetical protein